jgi:hypothetical protein
MTGDQLVTFGMYDDDDGLYIEIEGTQWLRACVKRGGVVTHNVDRDSFT